MFVSIKTRLQRGEKVITSAIGRILHHNIVQMIGMEPCYHAIWFDLEHMTYSTETLEVMALAARSVGLDSFVRLAPTDYASVTRALEAGVGGVMAAQVKTAEQVAEFLTWCKYYPRGCRGLNTSGYDAKFGKMPMAEFTQVANRDTFVAIQIETAEAVENVEKIVAVDGVDLLFVGPADLSQNLGVTGEFMHPKCLAAVDRVAAACAAAGKPWGVLPMSPEYAARCREKGCQMFTITSETRIISAGLNATSDRYSDIIYGK